MKRVFQVTLIAIFTGSVFFTSGKFVNATNTPKFYFVAICVFVIVAEFFIWKKQIRLEPFSTSRTILWSIHIICFLLAFYGLSQFLGLLPSNHSKFTVIGSFDNPAGFAAVMAIEFPIGLFLLAKTKRIEKYLASATLMIIITAIFLSDSRTGMLAIIVSSMVFLLSKTNVMSKFQQYRYYKLLSVMVVVCLVSIVSIFYHQKKDSANGRRLIWRVSSEMIKDKPIFGHGSGSFKAKYMDF